MPAGPLATWPLAQVPQMPGLFLLTLPGYPAVSVTWPKRETLVVSGYPRACREMGFGENARCSERTSFWPESVPSLCILHL